MKNSFPSLGGPLSSDSRISEAVRGMYGFMPERLGITERNLCYISDSFHYRRSHAYSSVLSRSLMLQLLNTKFECYS
uniref:Uncharacterized protein n=1 Tax=Romanomermis culicivorax TaxID=13658 RepID=A0A915KA59_ROMCU